MSKIHSLLTKEGDQEKVNKVVVQITAKKYGRELTPGEKLMANKVFNGRLNFDKLRMFNGTLAHIQPEGRAMTPVGKVYWPSEYYRDDFSQVRFSERNGEYIRHTFIHELAHVWQYQQNTNVIVRGLVNGAMDVVIEVFKDSVYYYDITNNKPFANYLLEQQAEMIADYYRMEYEGLPPYRTKNVEKNAQHIDAYRKKLAFLK
ncbi:hypothetical protein [Hydromonas duriensis]|uniref:Uncharacterized protein n=1 Tax=Hydromonas duriensis TaxID=1527608 RepID=A0A4R6Y6P7_9BURK|nr:hypothetical protein [Hydromonas duriensis]TDR27017.1 hypothetical protein DFR44_1565 [Hydromonas duriensis]